MVEGVKPGAGWQAWCLCWNALYLGSLPWTLLGIFSALPGGRCILSFLPPILIRSWLFLCSFPYPFSQQRNFTPGQDCFWTGQKQQPFKQLLTYLLDFCPCSFSEASLSSFSPVLKELSFFPISSILWLCISDWWSVSLIPDWGGVGVGGGRR